MEGTSEELLLVPVLELGLTPPASMRAVSIDIGTAEEDESSSSEDIELPKVT